MRISEPPKTEAERRALEKACLKEAKAAGFTGERARIEAVRRYYSALDECNRRVREPATQPSVIRPPQAAVPRPAMPRGMVQRESGLYVPSK